MLLFVFVFSIDCFPHYKKTWSQDKIFSWDVLREHFCNIKEAAQFYRCIYFNCLLSSLCHKSNKPIQGIKTVKFVCITIKETYRIHVPFWTFLGKSIVFTNILLLKTFMKTVENQFLLEIQTNLNATRNRNYKLVFCLLCLTNTSLTSFIWRQPAWIQAELSNLHDPKQLIPMGRILCAPLSNPKLYIHSKMLHPWHLICHTLP